MSGKVKRVTKTDGTILTFIYDGSGKRVKKITDKTGTNNDKISYYVYGSDGTLVETVERKGLTESPTGSVLQIEYPIYGSARLGMYKQTSSLSLADEIDMSAGDLFVRNLNRRFYELTDHLGASIGGSIEGKYNKDEGGVKVYGFTVLDGYHSMMITYGKNEDGEMEFNLFDQGTITDIDARKTFKTAGELDAAINEYVQKLTKAKTDDGKQFPARAA